MQRLVLAGLRADVINLWDQAQEHTAEILREWIGMSDRELAALLAGGSAFDAADPR